jgi:hypothetical protein
MTRVLLDAAMQRQLHNLSQKLELCDESGEVLAHLIPFGESEYERSEPIFPEEDLQRQEQANETRYTTAQVLAHLAKL